MSSLVVFLNLTCLAVIESTKVDTAAASCSEDLEFEFLHLHRQVKTHEL